MSCVACTTPTALLCHTADFQRPTFAVDTAGGTAPSYAAHLTGIAVRVQEETGSEIDEYGRTHTIARAVVFAPGDQDIKTIDRMVFGTRKFAIESVKNMQAANVLIRLDCTEILP